MKSQIHRTVILKQDLIDYITNNECKEYFFCIHGINIYNFKKYIPNIDNDKDNAN